MNHTETSEGLNRREMLARTAQWTAGAALLGTALSRRLEAAATVASAGKRIGFVDLNLENYHANVFLQALKGPLAARGFQVAGCWGLKEAEGKAWAVKNGVNYVVDLGELNQGVDCYMVIAPSNPEVHLQLCEKVLPFGKPTYVDKTFAPDVATAKAIFALADKHSTPMQTTSALRYTGVQSKAKALKPLEVQHMIAWGGGGSYAEYVIHPLELMISVMGAKATRLMRRGSEESVQLLVDFEGGRTGVVNVFPKTDTPFAATLTTSKKTEHVVVDTGRIFVDNMAAILDFFTSGKPNVERPESMAIMKLIEAARKPEARSGFVEV